MTLSSDELVRHNAAFAATGVFAGLPFPTSETLQVLGCLEPKAVADPYAAVRVDTAIARHALPPGRLVSGLVYDVKTGLIEIVDPATGE